MKIISILACGFITASIVSATDWKIKRTDNFIIIYTQEDIKYTDILSSALESSYPEITADIDFYPSRPIRVFLCRSQSQFDSLTFGRIPDWGVGCALSDQGVIVLKSPVIVQPNYNLSQVAIHELSHVVLGLAVPGKRIPYWFLEGLAMYQSREWKFGEDFALVKALIGGSIIPLSEITDSFPFREQQAQLAYIESFIAIAFIINQYGHHALISIVRELAKTGDFELALLRSIGLTLGEFETLWLEYIKKKYQWVSILSDTFIFWVIISLLFIIVYLLKRRKIKAKVKEWELEDKYQKVGYTGE